MSFVDYSSRVIVNPLRKAGVSVKHSLPTMAKVYAFTFLFFVLAWLFSRKIGLTTREFAADPAASLGVSPYMGMLSNLGITLWAAAVAVTVFSHFLVKAIPDIAPRWSSLFLASGLLSTLLLLDDLFMLHESYVTVLFGPEPDSIWIDRLGLRFFEGLFYAVYLSLVLLYLLKFRKLIFNRHAVFLIAALGFFALSMTIDILPIVPRGQILIEDGFKFFGQVSWVTYFSKTCYTAILVSQRALTHIR